MSPPHTTASDKPFAHELNARLGELVDVLQPGEPARPGYHVADQQEATLLASLDYFLHLKIHLDGSNAGQLGIRGFLHSPETLPRVTVSDDLREQLNQFFRQHHQHTEQKKHPAVYHRLYKIVSDYVDPPSDPELTVYKRPVSLSRSGAGRPDRAAEVVSGLELDKPLIVYCGGVLDFSERKGFIDRALNRLERLLYAADLPPADYNLYGIAYQNTSALRKTSVVHGYNTRPNEFASAHAHEFVRRILTPLLTDAGPGGKLRRADLQTVQRRFSKITFFTYSYGTVFVHEVENALREAMLAQTAEVEKDGYKKTVGMGFSEDEVKASISRLRAIAVGNTANVFDKRERGSIPIVITTARNDKLSQARSFNDHLLENDPVRELRHARVGNNLLLEAETVGDKAYAVRFVDTLDGRSVEEVIQDAADRLGPDAPIFSDKPGGGRAANLPRSFPFGVRDTSHHIVGGHHPVAYMRSTRQREDGEHTFQVHPGTGAVKAFFHEALEESLRACAGGAIRDDGNSLLDHLQERFLTPDAIARSVRDIKLGRRSFDLMMGMAHDQPVLGR